jgi:PAS domain S-box-containing protein
MLSDMTLNKPLKFIFIVSCITALAYPLLNIYFIFPSFSNLLATHAEEEAVRIAKNMSSLVISDNNELKKTNDFKDEIEIYRKDFNLEDVKVFSEQGRIIYSNNPNVIGKMNKESYFHKIVAKGNIYTKVVQRGFRTLEGRPVKADLVETYVPIMKGGKFIGAFEIYYDFTLKNRNLNTLAFRSSIIPLSLLFSFLVIIVITLLIADREDRGDIEIPGGKLAPKYLSPFYLLLIITISIFVAETVVMLLLSVFPPVTAVSLAILDSSLLTIIVSPMLYFFLLHPLKIHVAERKRVEDQLRESQEKYRSLVESTEDSIYLIDKDYKYLFVNRQHLSRLGYSLDRLFGHAYSEFHSPDDAGEFIGKADYVFKTGNSIQHEHRSRRDGQYFLRTLSPVMDPEGKTIAVSVVSKNITELKRIEEKLRGSHAQLRNLSLHLEEVREEERTNIAREIHDELGQRLTALKMDLSWLCRQLSTTQDSLFEKAKSMTNFVDNTIHTVKEISTRLRPSVLDHFGLTAAIEWQAEEFQNRTGIRCDITLEPEDMSLDQDCSTSIFRILQETLTNIVRHAQATRVKISLIDDSGMIVMKITDDGIGITSEQVSSPKSLGLLGIKERVRSQGGKVE